MDRLYKNSSILRHADIITLSHVTKHYRREFFSMKNLTKLALTLAAAGSVCYLFKDKIKASKAYQTVESNDTVRKAKETASDTYHKVKESDTVKKIKNSDTIKKIKDNENVQKAKATATSTIHKAKETVNDKYDKIKDTIKDKMESTDDGDREYFTLHENETSATEAPKSSDTSEATTAKVVTETVAEAEDVLAEATDAVSNAADSDTSDVIGDEYMGLSDVSEDPSVLSEQDKLDV